MISKINNFEELAAKCLKQTKNKLYFNYKSLSPAIYRMPIEYVESGMGTFGTDATKIYADPMSVVIKYKKSPDELMRTYLHMLFHCIYLHPFVTKYDIDKSLWNIALDICVESAVMRLDPKEILGDNERVDIINKIKSRIKMFLPELVYKELTTHPDDYDFIQIAVLFRMDDHLWLEQKQGNGGSSDNQDDNDYQNPNQQPQNDNDDQNDDNDGQNDDNDDQDGNGNNNNQQNSDQNDNNQNNGQNQNGNGQNNGNNKQQKSQSNSAQQQKKQEWSDVSRQVAADMQSFHKQGTQSGDTIQEIDFLTQDKMDYDEFLRQFSVIEEKMMVNLDEFDYMYYTYGLNMPGNKKKLLIEPLEYKEEKVIKDFVIAIDTSGSCSGDLVKRFLNKTYSILKETESFSSRVNIHIIQCDAAVQNDTKITNMDEMEHFLQNMKLYGFGGTDFRPVFSYVDELIHKKEFTNLCGLIYFTDGYGTYPTQPTPYKTAFAFLEDYDKRDVPPWAMSVYWKEDDK